LRIFSGSTPVHAENDWLPIKVSQLPEERGIHKQRPLRGPNSVGAVHVTEDMKPWALLDYGGSQFGIASVMNLPRCAVENPVGRPMGDKNIQILRNGAPMCSSLCAPRHTKRDIAIGGDRGAPNTETFNLNPGVDQQMSIRDLVSVDMRPVPRPGKTFVATRPLSKTSVFKGQGMK
jgi:hypothetical protein